MNHDFSQSDEIIILAGTEGSAICYYIIFVDGYLKNAMNAVHGHF